MQKCNFPFFFLTGMMTLAQGMFDRQIAPISIISWRCFCTSSYNAGGPFYAFLNWHSPFLQGNLVSYNWGSPQIRLSLAKTSAYFSSSFLASCWSVGSHLAHPKRLPYLRMVCSRVKTLCTNCREIGISWASSFSGALELLSWLTSSCSFKGEPCSMVQEYSEQEPPQPFAHFLSQS